MSRYCQTCAADRASPAIGEYSSSKTRPSGSRIVLRFDASAVPPQLVEKRVRRRPRLSAVSVAQHRHRPACPADRRGGNRRQNASLTSSTRPSSDSTTTPSFMWATRLFSSNECASRSRSSCFSLVGLARGRCVALRCPVTSTTRSDVAFELAGQWRRPECRRVYQAVHAVGAQPSVCRLEGHSVRLRPRQTTPGRRRDRQDAGLPPSRRRAPARRAASEARASARSRRRTGRRRRPSTP